MVAEDSREALSFLYVRSFVTFAVVKATKPKTPPRHFFDCVDSVKFCAPTSPRPIGGQSCLNMGLGIPQAPAFYVASSALSHLPL